MSFKHTSWGRTRGPKSLVNTPGGSVAVLANIDDLKGVTASTAGYPTENQRYLHVLLEDANGTEPTNPLTIFGYCHAFQRWFEIPQSQAAGAGSNTGPTASSFSVADSGRAPALQVPSDREYRRYDIAGIDKVAFVNADPTEVNVFAACSTF
jgi:hypothetical protein